MPGLVNRCKSVCARWLPLRLRPPIDRAALLMIRLPVALSPAASATYATTCAVERPVCAASIEITSKELRPAGRRGVERPPMKRARASGAYSMTAVDGTSLFLRLSGFDFDRAAARRAV